MSQTLLAIQQACTAQVHMDSPLGTMLLARTAAGLAGVWFEGQQHHPGQLSAAVRPDDPLLEDATQQLRRYFNGESAGFSVPLDLLGTPFQRRVWHELLKIGIGLTSATATLPHESERPARAERSGRR